MPEHERGKPRRDLVTLLQRATQHVHGPAARARASELLDYLVKSHTAPEFVAVAIETPGLLIDLLSARTDKFDSNALEAILRVFPDGTFALAEWEVLLDARGVALARGRFGNSAEDNFKLAKRLCGYASSLLRVKRYEHALSVAEEAVIIARDANDKEPDTFPRILANCLLSLGVVLSDTGDHARAVACCREAREILISLGSRGVAMERFPAHISQLASLDLNIGAQLFSLGQHEDAFKSTQSAIERYEFLDKLHPGKGSLDSIKSIIGLGLRLLALDRYEDARETTTRAITMLRGLSIGQTDAAQELLAGSLRNLSSIYLKQEKASEGLIAIDEAVTIILRLHQFHPEIMAQELAWALHTRGHLLLKTNRYEKAAESLIEEIAILESLHHITAEATSHLAETRLHAATLLAECDRRNEAVSVYGAGLQAYKTCFVRISKNTRASP